MGSVARLLSATTHISVFRHLSFTKHLSVSYTIMFPLLLSIFLLFLSSSSCFHIPQDRIVGGEDASPGEFPWQVELTWGVGGSLLCGGSLVTESMVITAAHCCEDMSPSDLGVVVGSYHLHQNDPDQASFSVTTVIQHELYNKRTKENDICLLELDGRVNLDSPNIGLVRLPEAGEEYEAGLLCTVTGWGATSQGGGSPRVLQKVRVPIVSNNECQFDYIMNEITESMMCAGFDEGGKDSCQGDSGGPLMCGDILSGIVSWGKGCGERAHPGVYTQVSYFVSWIHDHVRRVEKENKIIL